MPATALNIEGPFDDRSGPMEPKEPNKAAARRAVAERLRRFIAALMSRFTSTPDEVMHKAEKKADEQPT